MTADGVYVEVLGTVEDGGPSADTASDEDIRVGGVRDRIDAASVRLSDTVFRFCSSIQESLGTLNFSEVSIEFGVGVTAGLAIPFVTSGSTEGTVKVTAKWTRSQEYPTR